MCICVSLSEGISCGGIMRICGSVSEEVIVWR